MPRVLIVDNEGSIREQLVQIVKSEGLEVTEAEDGVAALDLVREQCPDVILLDNAMPNLDGLGFLTSLKESPALGKPPVIMVAEKGTPEERQSAVDLGVVDYISKPWKPGEIELRLKWALKEGSTIPAVPWELSDAESAAGEDDSLELQTGNSDDDDDESDEEWTSLDLPEGSESEVMTPEEGGWLETKDGRVRVTLPAGAVRQAMALSASPTTVDAEPNPASLRVRLGNQATDLTFSDKTGSPVEGVRLDRPIEIALKLDPEEIEKAGDPSKLHVQEFDNKTQEWSDMPTRIDLKTGVAKVRKVDFPPPEHHRKEATVMVIAEAGSDQDSLCQGLNTAGYDIVAGTTPHEIIKTIVDRKPDVILLDLAFRGHSGLKILRQIKGESQTRQVAIITLGEAVIFDPDDPNPSDYAQSIALGARDMISKPWQPGDLQSRVARAVAASKARALQAERAVERAKARTGGNRLAAPRGARQRRPQQRPRMPAR